MPKKENQLVTKSEFNQGIDKLNKRMAGLEKRLTGLNGRVNRMEKSLLAKVELMIEEAKMEIDEKARKYRDRILNAFDQFVGEIKTSQGERAIIAGRLANPQRAPRKT